MSQEKNLELNDSQLDQVAGGALGNTAGLKTQVSTSAGKTAVNSTTQDNSGSTLSMTGESVASDPNLFEGGAM